MLRSCNASSGTVFRVEVVQLGRGQAHATVKSQQLHCPVVAAESKYSAYPGRGSRRRRGTADKGISGVFVGHACNVLLWHVRLSTVCCASFVVSFSARITDDAPALKNNLGGLVERPPSSRLKISTYRLFTRALIVRACHPPPPRLPLAACSRPFFI